MNISQLTVIKVDGMVSINGRAFIGLDLSLLDAGIHAIQWSGGSGIIELMPDGNGMLANVQITNLDFAQAAIDAWTVAANLEDNPPPLSLGELSVKKFNYINRKTDETLSQITSTYPKTEVDSWPKQETEARAYTADQTAPTPLLTAMAEVRGITVADLAARVILKADAFAGIAGAAMGKRQALEDHINLIVNNMDYTDAEKIAALELIVW